MNSVALKYFNEVARSGSIAAASLRLHVAGSAVSRQIVSLEYEIGTPLFERQPRGMILTAAGERLAQHVRRYLLEEERVVAEIRSRGERTIGTIRIATSQGLASSFLPEAARLYREDFPEIRFAIHALSPADIVSAVADGSSDVGVAFVVATHPGVEVKHRSVVPLYALMSPKHPLGRRKHVSLHELQEFPFATSRDTTVRGMINLRAAILGFQPKIVFECDYSDGLFSFCSTGEAVTFGSPLSAANWINRGELVAIPLFDAQLYERNLEIQSMEGRTLPAHIEEWIGFLVRHLAEAMEQTALHKNVRRRRLMAE